MSRQARTLSLIGLTGLILGGCALLLLLPRAPLLLAQWRWANRPFTNYRLVVDVTMYTQFCRYDIVVHGEQIVAVNENWCDRHGLFYTKPLDEQTVDDLFHHLSREWQGLRCGVGSCRCGHPVVLAIEYDAELGYPVTWSRQRVDLGPEVIPPCAVDIGEGPAWQVSRLEPLD